MPEVLYHPHFEPSLSWLRSSLLVYDKVSSIVPGEASYVPSDQIKRHLEKLPDTFATVVPEPVDIVSEYFVLGVLGQAFKRMAAQPVIRREQKMRLKYDTRSWGDDNEGLDLQGITRLHDNKVAYTVYQMLEESRLIYGRTDDGFSFVDERAAFLIVSFLAQRMATRLPMRTITDVDSSFLLSVACNVIESGDPIDSRGVLASSVLKFHVPEEIGSISISDFIEIRKRYEGLREAFPLYLRDLAELIQVNDVTQAAELKARIESLVNKLDEDMAGIKRSRLGESIRKWLPVGIGSAVTLGSAFLPDAHYLKYVTGAATVVVQVLTEAIHQSRIPGRIEGTQNLLLSAKNEILNAAEMALSLDRSTIV